MSAPMEKAIMGMYDFAWTLAMPFLSRNSRLAEGLEQRRLITPLPKADLWIQAASVGESFLARSIVNHLSPCNPIQVLVTTNTGQGMDILTRNNGKKNFPGSGPAVSYAYFPFDKPSLMKKAVSDVNPRTVVLLESELWPGLLDALKRCGTGILLINGRINPESLRKYMIWKSFWKNRAPDRILAVSKKDAGRFAILFGKDRVSTMPNIKFDQAGPVSVSPEVRRRISKLLPKNPSFLALASVRREEEPLVEKMITKILSEKPDTIIGLFPRHMHRLEYWQRTLNRLAAFWKLRSETDVPVKSGSVILWDTFGELAASYSLARAAFVGGSLAPLGGQNFLEPLTCGIIPVIGPSWYNFYWVGREIFDFGLVNMAENWRDAASKIIKNLSRDIPRNTIQDEVMEYIRRRRGGTEQACRAVIELLNRN